MVKSKRAINATAEETLTPPTDLTKYQVIAKIIRSEGSNLWRVSLPDGEDLLAELPIRFRSIFWLKRGGFVVIDGSAFQDRQNKINGEIVNIVRNEKEWRKQPYWPAEFAKAVATNSEDYGNQPLVGQMPPQDDSE